MLVVLIVGVAGISITGRVARLVKRNYKAIKMILTEEGGRGRGPAGERKKRRISGAGGGLWSFPRSDNSNPADEPI